MPRQVKAKRQELQNKKYRGLIIQFAIFLSLRTIDLGASIAVLENAWEQSWHWTEINDTLLNATSRIRRSISPGSFIPGDNNPHRITRRDFEPPNVDFRNDGPPSIDPRNDDPRRFNPGQNDPRKRRSIKSPRRGTIVPEQCADFESWTREKIDSKISKYKAMIGLTVFFNIVSLSVFLTHLGFWIATIRITMQDGIDYKTRVTRLARNSLLSLSTAVIRDVPLSCLNLELLTLRSGREGLACVACIFAGKCPPEDYVENSLNLAKGLLSWNYLIMLFNSLWKGVSGFYRLSRFKDFNLYFIRTCASMVFGFLYCITTFTPAMYMFIYRYFAIPGTNAPFVEEFAKRIVVIGTVIWVIFGSAVVCFPVLYAIRLSTN